MTDIAETASKRPRIVVGTDGSPAAQPAVIWAIHEAVLRDADLDVVVAWQYPYEWAEGFNDRWADDCKAFAADANKAASDAVDTALDRRPRPPWIRTCAIQGSAAQALLEFSEGAALLVVGSRGRGGFADLLLGSVSTACVHHARCPVTVVPHTATLPDSALKTDVATTAES